MFAIFVLFRHLFNTNGFIIYNWNSQQCCSLFIWQIFRFNRRTTEIFINWTGKKLSFTKWTPFLILYNTTQCFPYVKILQWVVSTNFVGLFFFFRSELNIKLSKMNYFFLLSKLRNQFTNQKEYYCSIMFLTEKCNYVNFSPIQKKKRFTCIDKKKERKKKGTLTIRNNSNLILPLEHGYFCMILFLLFRIETRKMSARQSRRNNKIA